MVTGTVLPWITLLFASLASLLSFVYARQLSRAVAAARTRDPNSGYADEKAAEQQETQHWAVWSVYARDHDRAVPSAQQ